MEKEKKKKNMLSNMFVLKEDWSLYYSSNLLLSQTQSALEKKQ